MTTVGRARCALRGLATPSHESMHTGASNHCAHGGSEMTETITDWRPFDYYSAQSYEPKWKSIMDETTQFVPLDNGRATEVHYHFRMNLPLPRVLRAPLCRFMMKKVFKVDETYASK